MNYENFKTGFLRTCIFLTVLIMFLAFLGSDGMNSSRMTILFGITLKPGIVMVLIPILIWTSYFFILWITKGFIGKK